MTVMQARNTETNSWSGQWGPERFVEVRRTCNTNLGFSIVGGKVEVVSEVADGLQETEGIFIKNVKIDNSNEVIGQLKVGDRILEVNGNNIRDAPYEKAVEVIKNTGDSVKLLVQSFLVANTDENVKDQEAPVTPEADVTESSLAEADDSEKKEDAPEKEPEAEDEPEPAAKDESESEESSDSEDERLLEGNIRTKGGVEIERRSAGNMRRTDEEIKADPETEDEFGYTAHKIKKKYGHLGKEVMLITLKKNKREVGICLAGHKERSEMGVFVCGLNPAMKSVHNDQLKIGDEILEVNGRVFIGRSHLNASVTIKNLPQKTMKFIIVRRPSEDSNSAVRAVTYFPDMIDELEQYSNFENVRSIEVNKGIHGMGIMIIQGKHAKVGQGIFVSDIQEGSAAEKAGLQVGDMILAVNSTSLLNSTYDEAANTLKLVEGIVTLIICSTKTTEPEAPPSSGANNELPAATDASKPKTPQKSPLKVPGDATPAAATAPPSPKAEEKVNKGPITLEFPLGSGPIGFQIAGGFNTPSKGIFIIDISSKIGDDKRKELQVGDRIVDFGTENFKAIEYENAKAAVLSASGNIKMAVSRENIGTEEVTADLYKKAGKGLGLHIIGLSSGKGAYISELLPGGSAIESGKLQFGDRIVEISGENVNESSVEDIALLLKISEPLKLKVVRYKTLETQL